MVLKPISHRLPDSIDIQKKREDRLFWQQCQRFYTFQPIYQVTGRLMAIEVLTAVVHPSAPQKRLSPELYFDALDISQRVFVLHEQLRMLSGWREKLQRDNIVASVNIDGPTLLAIQHHPEIRELIAQCSWLRFELVEHQILPQEEIIAQMPELGPIWLDDFGAGMANFSALTELKYDYIKLARELFVMLRRTEEGRNMFNLLLALIGNYCRGVIVEGVETIDEWLQVQGSPAFAAQGYYFARPMTFDKLESLPLRVV